jgi:hypothetical protein
MFKYHLCVEPNNVVASVRSVTFDIGRYGQLTHTITFTDPVTESAAVTAAEKWLSKPLSNEEFSSLKEERDLFCGGEDACIDDFKCRGDALGDCKFLEGITREHSHMTICCGS